MTCHPHLHLAGLQVEAEQRVMMVAEGNSTYMECLPRSRHAAVTWYKQAGENSPELNQVNTSHTSTSSTRSSPTMCRQCSQIKTEALCSYDGSRSRS